MHLTKWANEGVLPTRECKQVENTDIRGVKWKSCQRYFLHSFSFYLGILSQLFLRNLSFLFWKERMVASVWWGLRE